MLNKIADFVDEFSYLELAGLITACGYAIREQTTLSTALLKFRICIPSINNEDGFLHNEIQDVVFDCELAKLAYLSAMKLVFISPSLRDAQGRGASAPLEVLSLSAQERHLA
ncbi:MAG: hypothetical protein KME30_31900 [Iphinoe sp. HA4291-MV1]|jgi:hypothetical protein|nr:hypothetical protein [Iphinoe sp. HA4291-MV1]